MSDDGLSQNTSVSSIRAEEVHCFGTLKCSSSTSKTEQESKLFLCHYLSTFLWEVRRGKYFCYSSPKEYFFPWPKCSPSWLRFCFYWYELWISVLRPDNIVVYCAEIWIPSGQEKDFSFLNFFLIIDLSLLKGKEMKINHKSEKPHWAYKK